MATGVRSVVAPVVVAPVVTSEAAPSGGAERRRRRTEAPPPRRAAALGWRQGLPCEGDVWDRALLGLRRVQMKSGVKKRARFTLPCEFGYVAASASARGRLCCARASARAAVSRRSCNWLTALMVRARVLLWCAIRARALTIL